MELPYYNTIHTMRTITSKATAYEILDYSVGKVLTRPLTAAHIPIVFLCLTTAVRASSYDVHVL